MTIRTTKSLCLCCLFLNDLFSFACLDKISFIVCSETVTELLLKRLHSLHTMKKNHYNAEATGHAPLTHRVTIETLQKLKQLNRS